MEITLSILFWGFLIAYCIHIVEEAAVGEGFVKMMKETFWPEYTGRMFFGFNTMIFLVFTAGLILYEIFGGVWVIWPLSFAFMFVTNGIWHLLQTVVLKKFSPGLITSPIYWILIYFIIRYYVIPGDILIIDFIISMVMGTIITLLMFGSAYYFKLKTNNL
jgi:hypothetical protein